MDDIAIGRKQIMEMVDVAVWDTVKRWKRRWNFPVRYLPNGKPMVIASEYLKWAIMYDEKRPDK
jgi:hypothetical protein